jgi:hypothetical protein
VSCASAHACVAVGFYVIGQNQSTVLAEHWDGSGWTLQEPVVPKGAIGSALTDVSCVSINECTAVGYFTDSTGNQRTLLETWNGVGWQIQPAATVYGSLKAVSCIGSSMCAAVGEAGADGLVASWNGTAWRTKTYPLEPSAVSCASATMCAVVGGDPAGGPPVGWLDGIELTLAHAASLIGLTLNGVSCASATFCMAATSYNQTPPFEKWDGSGWSSIAATREPMNAVSCTSATNCIAVGQGPAMSWDGIAWSIENPPAVQIGALNAVSCTGLVCIAVGGTNGSTGVPIAVERS